MYETVGETLFTQIKMGGNSGSQQPGNTQDIAAHLGKGQSASRECSLLRLCSRTVYEIMLSEKNKTEASESMICRLCLHQRTVGELTRRAGREDGKIGCGKGMIGIFFFPIIF